MAQIETFVFFDIETTGLPWLERNQTKIIEFCFVAASREDLQVTKAGSIPLVSKLAFVLNPLRPLSPEVTQMTGLTNKKLKNAPLFENKVKTIRSFLRDLPKPICLVAHNGNLFDFKILLAELNDASASASLPDDLLCVDSLVGFRKLLKGTNINYTTILAVNETPTPSSSSGDLTDDDDDDGDHDDDEEEWPEFDVSTQQWDEIDEIFQSMSDVSTEDSSELEWRQKRRRINQVKEARSKAIKNVFVKKENKVNKECFKLSAVYKRLLNKKESNAHRAEADCMMLVECVVALKNNFLPWADGASKLLTQIKPIRY